MPSPRILFVDNDTEFLQARSEHLQKQGYEVTTATSLIDAREKINNHEFNLAIVDVRLSDDQDERDVSGLMLASSLPMPTIALTSFADYRLTREAFASSRVEDVIRKQDGVDSFNRTVKDVIKTTMGSASAAAYETATYKTTTNRSVIVEQALVIIAALFGVFALITQNAWWLLGVIFPGVIISALMLRER